MHCHTFFTKSVVQYIAPPAREDAGIDSYVLQMMTSQLQT